MTGKRVACVALSVACASIAATSSHAQVLDREIDRLLGDDCAQLGVQGGNTNFPNSLGAALDLICEPTLPGGAVGTAGGGGAAPSPGSDSSLARQRADERLQQERRGLEPDADSSSASEFARRFRIEGLGVWLNGDIEDRNRDVTSFEDGFDSSIESVTGGVDYRFLDSLFAGLAVQYQHVGGDFDGGGDFETESLGGTFYASLSPLPDAFVDVVVSYASKDYAVDRAISFQELVNDQITGNDLINYEVSGIASQDSDGDEVQARALVGYDRSWGSVGLGPRAGVNFVSTHVDGYRESGSTGLELVVADRTRQSLQSVVGLNASVTASASFGVIVPELDVEWIHEFQDDQRGTRVRFAEDLRPQPLVFRFENEKPDRDWFALRGGISLGLPYGIQAFVQARTLLGHDEYRSYGLTAGLRAELGGGGAR